MKIDLKKNDKLTRLIIVVLVGFLLLLAVQPVTKVGKGVNDEDSADEIKSEIMEFSNYYEERLKNMLERSYGEGTMDVMVHVKEVDKRDSFYGGSSSNYVIDGVMVVAKVKDSNAVADINYAICALFDLPAHKVSVIVKK